MLQQNNSYHEARSLLISPVVRVHSNYLTRKVTSSNLLSNKSYSQKSVTVVHLMYFLGQATVNIVLQL